MMTLAEFLKSTNTRQSDFAAAVGVTQATISRISSGKVAPSIGLASAIIRETRGLVGLEAWVACESKPAASAAPSQETPHVQTPDGC